MPRLKNATTNFSLNMYRGKWHLCWTDPATGLTRRRSTGTADRSEAQSKVPALESEVRTGLNGTKVRNNFKLGDLLDGYESQLDTSKQSTLHALRHLRRYFCEFKPEQLNDASWTGYRKWRTGEMSGSAAHVGKHERKVSDSTACRELHAMRSAIKWAQRNGWPRLGNAKVRIANEPNTAVQEYLTPAEVERLIEACESRHQRLFIRLAIATGARMSALLELKWDQIRWPGAGKGYGPPLETDALAAVNVTAEPTVEWTAPETGEPHWRDGYGFELNMREALRIDLGQGCGNKRRGTGIIARSNFQLYDELVAAHNRRNTDFVLEHNGKPIKTRINLKPVYRRAGLEGYSRTQHLLKHTCCSWLVQSGASCEAVAKLVGTTAKVIETHYGHLSPDHLETMGEVLTVDA